MKKSNTMGNKALLVRGIALGIWAWLSLGGTDISASETTKQPVRFSSGNDTYSVYQPQVESYDKGTRRVVARSAFSVKTTGVALKFGAIRYQATVKKQGSGKPVRFSEIDILELKYPGASKRRLNELEAHLGSALDEKALEMDRKAFETALDELDDGAGFRDSAPKIYYEESPAVLVFIDGKPVLREVESGYFKYVINTAYFIVLNPDNNYFYLKGGKWWYRAKKIDGPWKVVENVPVRISRLAKNAFETQRYESDDNLDNLTSAPKIIVSTFPAELIVLNGEPNLAPIEGTGLLYVDNTENDIIMEIATQKYYVLLSGRWYRSKSLNDGKWEYVPGDELPKDFSKISETSNMASVLSSVAGTDEADTALLNNTIPEVAAIDRSLAKIEVTYDGEPEFARIQGTAVLYAVNADKTVLKIGDRYYAVHEGVWYEAPTPRGTWQVAVEVPTEIYEIPPSAPVYHVRYVYVYDYTPDYVYVGYTPGYYCSYVYHGTVVYGTGFYYRPWIRRLYFSRHVTFGFGVHFHPFVGWWGFPIGVSYGWIGWGWFPFPCAYWGPAGYLYGYRHGYYHGESHGYYQGYRNGYRHGYSAGRSAGHRAVYRDSKYNSRASANLYRHRADVIKRTVPRTTRARQIPIPKRRPVLSNRQIRESIRPTPATRRVQPKRHRFSTPARRPTDRIDKHNRRPSMVKPQFRTKPDIDTNRFPKTRNRPAPKRQPQIPRRIYRTPPKAPKPTKQPDAVRKPAPRRPKVKVQPRRQPSPPKVRHRPSRSVPDRGRVRPRPAPQRPKSRPTIRRPSRQKSKDDK